MKTKTKLFLMILFVFIFSFIWIFSLSYNFPYFWEDEPIVYSYLEYRENPENYSFSKIGIQMLKKVVSLEPLYQLEYVDRPLRWSQMKLIFPIHNALYKIVKSDILIDRFLKTMLFSFFACLIFSFFYKVGSKHNKKTIAFLLLGYILVLPETWAMPLYFNGETVIGLFFMTSALALYYFYYRNNKLQNKVYLIFLFVCIVLLTHLSSLLKHFGRVNFLIIFLFLLVTSRKKILSLRHGLLILALFLISVPFLGVITAIFSEGTVFETLGMANHLDQNVNISEKLLTFFSTLHLSFLPHAFVLLLLFFVFFLLHLYALFKKREALHSSILLKRLVVFSFFWYFLMAFCFYMARTFVFDPRHYLRMEFSIFIVPQALFLVGYAFYVYRRYFPAKKILIGIIYLFMIVAIVHNMDRLNGWRGGWGSYFLGFDSALQYVDEDTTNSIMLIKPDHSYPVYSISTNKLKMAGSIDISLLEEYQKNYTKVFIVGRDPFKANSKGMEKLLKVTKLETKDNSPYGIFKRLIRKNYDPMWIYEFKVGKK